MQRFISKYGLAAHLAFLAVAPLFLSSTAVICLSALAMIWVIMEPSRIGNESLHEARKRVHWGILCDPVFWVSIVLLAMATIRYFNSGVMRNYDAETAKWFLSMPKMSLLPGSVEGCGYAEIAMTAALIPLLQGCRRAMGRAARMMFASFVTGIAGIVALILAAGYHLEYPSVRALTELSTLHPDYYGATFGVYFAIGVAALFGVMERGWWRTLPLVMVGIAGTGAALFMFAPAYVQVIFAAVALLVFIYAFVVARITISQLAEFKLLVFFGLSLVLGSFIVYSITDHAFIDIRVKPYLTGAFFTEKYQEVRQLMNAISFRIWKIHPWIGSGLGAYPMSMAFQVTQEEWITVNPLQTAPLNGYWMLLVERGTIGAFMMASTLVLLLWTYFVRLTKGVTAKLPGPLCWAGLLILIGAALQAVMDISFLNPAMTLAIATVLALSAKSFPMEKQKNGK